MPNLRQPADLENLAGERFGRLSDSEVKMLRAASKGEIAYCGSSSTDDDPNNDPTSSNTWGEERWIRAELVRWLCVEAKDCVDRRGIRAHAARITGKLDLSFVVVPFFLGLVSCSFSDDLNLAFVEIPAIDLSRSCLPSLKANYVSLKGNISLEGLWAEGTVQLQGARIGGGLLCDGAKFANPAQAGVAGGGTALDLRYARVTGALNLRYRFAAEGQVRLYACEIGGNLDCEGAKFRNPAQANIDGSGIALNAEHAKVSGSVLLRNGFAAEGEVWLHGCEIGGTLDCDGGKFQNPAQANVDGSGVALSAEGAKVTGSVLLRNGFAAVGQVWMYGARIAGVLECRSSRFETLCLTNVSAGAIMDDEESWPQRNLSLDGFTYGRISGGPRTAKKRLKWLERQASFTQQPYRQLAEVLKEAGDDEGWRRVCAAMERKTWKRRSWLFAPVSYLLRVTIGYGYYSNRALWCLLGLVVVGSVLYSVGYRAGSVVPTEKDAYDSFAVHKGLPGHYQDFHALPYSLENSFPFVKLGVQEKWMPGSDRQDVSSPPNAWSRRFLLRFASPSFLRWFRWAQICAGWLLATLFVSGVTGVIRRG